MHAAKIVLASAGVLGLAQAQNVAPSSATAPSDVMREVRHRLGLIATRAIANFHSMDSIEENLRDLGAVLHPDLVALRGRIEAALNDADAASDESDPARANEALDRAQAFLDRLAARLGGG